MGHDILKEKPYRKVYIEITNICNLSCAFCAGTQRKKEFMSLERFVTVLDKVVPYTDYIYLHVLGEPLLHPNVSEMLDEAQKRALKVVLVTNGTKLCELSDMLLSKKSLHKVNISLHALEANPALDKDKYLEACFDFADRASKNGIVSVFRLWNGKGENRLNAQIEEKLHGRFSHEWRQNSKGFRLREKLFLEYADRFKWKENSTVKEQVRCYALKDQFAVLCDGTVIPCCIDCEGMLGMGNIETNELSDMLSGHLATELRRGFECGKAVFDTCKKCGFVRTRL